MDRLEPESEIDRALLTAPHDQMSRRFVAAWLGWRGAARLVPNRSAVELADIKELLGRIVLFELIGPDEILVKVAGTQLRDYAAFEATGRNFAELTPPAQWQLRRWRMREMATLPCGGVMTSRNGGDGFTFETVTLPIAPDDPAAPPLLMSHIAVLGGVYAPPAKDRPALVPLADSFRFADLGAGIPHATTP